MSSPDCPTIKFIIQSVDKKDHQLFSDFNKKMVDEARIKSRVIKHLLSEVVEENIKLPKSTLNLKELKRRKSNLI